MGGYAHLTLLVEDAAGYRNLCRLLTAAHSHTRDSSQRSAGQPSVTLEQVEEHAEGLVCLSGCAGDGMLAAAWERGDAAAAAQTARQAARRLRAATASGSSCSGPSGAATAAATAGSPGSPSGSGCPPSPPATSTLTRKRRAHLQDAFVAIRLGMTLEASEPLRRGNRSSALRSPRAMAERFAEHPEAVAETLRLAERLEFDLSRELGYRYPRAEEPGVDRKLAELCRALLAERYAGLLVTGARPRSSSRTSWRRSAPSASPASSSSTTTCSSSPARSPPRCAAGSRPARSCRPAAAAAPASARSSAT